MVISPIGGNEMKDKCSVFSEYDQLKKVILCEPRYMMIREVINETQKHFMEEGINIERALEQHANFVHLLREKGIEVILLPYFKKYAEQVFTRDIGFTLGGTVFVAEMASEIRRGEENVLKEWLEDEGVSYYNFLGNRIEGGDVIIDRDAIFIGLSNRTNVDAADHLQDLLPQFKVHAIPFKAEYLHLDCVFNVVSQEIALVFKEALNNEEIQFLGSRYDLIEVTKEEQFRLGTNVLAIGNNQVVSLPVNKDVNSKLRKKGFEVIEIDITEIIKSGGSFRCCTLPILRN